MIHLQGAPVAPDAPVSAVAVSSCGNYGLVGTAAGRVDRYNMQSGLHRGFYARSVMPAHEVLRTGCAKSGSQALSQPALQRLYMMKPRNSTSTALQ